MPEHRTFRHFPTHQQENTMFEENSNRNFEESEEMVWEGSFPETEAAASETQAPSAVDSLREAVLDLSKEDRLSTEDISRLIAESQRALKERQISERKAIFAETVSRLVSTGIIETLQGSVEDPNRKEVLRDIKQFFSDLGIKLPLGTLEQLISKSQPSSKTARKSSALQEGS